MAGDKDREHSATVSDSYAKATKVQDSNYEDVGELKLRKQEQRTERLMRENHLSFLRISSYSWLIVRAYAHLSLIVLGSLVAYFVLTDAARSILELTSVDESYLSKIFIVILKDVGLSVELLDILVKQYPLHVLYGAVVVYVFRQIAKIIMSYNVKR